MLALIAPVTSDISVGNELLRVLLNLGGIVALIFVAGWLSRRAQGRARVGGRRIRCVESFAVGARERVLLLDADGKRLLIGMGPGGMRTLHVYDGAVYDSTTPGIGEAAPAPFHFSDVLAVWKRKP
ncbi:FliO/MopB family protein [Dyella tabacisoli]|uniref:Flagellar biosynthesis protein FliO n=1 Tax=Dyella tabacisoli TaxID=2282381 RepID=A0A369UJK8_9GAMM|nr:flagellar biosynthetic protein FliO [Dyella tabacisoli]RDD79770.1 flagellar biosynthesis protein FliO [Dyella tabacisoli]